MNNVLGESREEIRLESAEENRDAALSLARQARHKIHIFSQQLDAAVYDNDAFEHCVFELASRHQSAEIRILLQNSTYAVQHSHRLVELSQKLTSSVFIRKPPDSYKDVAQAFMTVDDVGVLYRAQGSNNNYNATVNFMSPQRASELDHMFTEIWEHSTPDPHLRRLFV